MFGLIRKDIYYLKKNLKLFAIVNTGIIMIAVLFVLSCRFGNMKMVMEEMIVEGGFTKQQNETLLKMAIEAILFIPIAFVSMIVECFKEDKKASFNKQLLSLPIDNKQIVGSKFFACIVFLIISACVSFLAAFFISLASDIYVFTDFIGCIISFSAMLLAYMSIVMFLLYIFGAEKADLIQCVPFVIISIVCSCLFSKKILSFKDKEFNIRFEEILGNGLRFIEDKCLILFIGALVIFILSYLGACFLFEKRKERL